MGCFGFGSAEEREEEEEEEEAGEVEKVGGCGGGRWCRFDGEDGCFRAWEGERAWGEEEMMGVRARSVRCNARWGW